MFLIPARVMLAGGIRSKKFYAPDYGASISTHTINPEYLRPVAFLVRCVGSSSEVDSVFFAAELSVEGLSTNYTGVARPS